MIITVTKGDISVTYEEPQTPQTNPRLVNSESDHKKILEAIKCICEQVENLSKF